MEEAYEYSEEELKKLGDAIVWTTILAAIHNDGIINESEKAEAIKQTHIRTFSTAAYLRPIYKYLEDHFEENFNNYSAQLTGSQEEKELFVQSKVSEAMEILPIIGPLFTERFTKDVSNLYNTVFHTDSSIFQIFLLPIITGHLERFGLK